MPSIPRQDIDEIVVRHEQQPNLVDIYVEGEFDRDFINYFINNITPLEHVTVHPIDTVHIPEGLVAKLGFGTGSNKSRVLALAKILLEKAPNLNGKIMCAVDADFDRILGRLISGKYIKYTDFTCLEMYFIGDRSLKKYLEFTCKIPKGAAKEFLDIAKVILPIQFCTRALNETASLSANIPDFRAGLYKTKSLKDFSKDVYFNSFLIKNGLTRDKQTLSERFLALQDSLPEDLRHKANGRDFIKLLFDYTWIKEGIKLHSKDEDVTKFGARLLASNTDASELFNNNLFNEILQLCRLTTVAH